VSGRLERIDAESHVYFLGFPRVSGLDNGFTAVIRISGREHLEIPLGLCLVVL
jgi:hypothetical protein